MQIIPIKRCVWLLWTASKAAGDLGVWVSVQLGGHRRAVLGVRPRGSRLRTRLSTETLLGMCHTLISAVCPL